MEWNKGFCRCLFITLREHPSILCFPRVFIMCGVLNFIKCFFCNYWDDYLFDFFIYEHGKLHWLLLTIKVTTKFNFSWCIIIFICFEIWFSKKLLRIFPSMLWSQSICTFFFFLIVYFNGFDFGAVLDLKGVEMCSSFYFL